MGFPSSPTRLDMRQTPAAYLRNLADELAGQGLDLGTSAGMSASAARQSTPFTGQSALC